MQSRFSIRTRMLLVLAAVAIASAGFSSWRSYRIARSSLEQKAFDQLTAVREMRANQVEDYMGLIIDQLVTLAESPMIVAAMGEFRNAFRSLEGELRLDPKEFAQRDLRLRRYYEEDFLERLSETTGAPSALADYWPSDRTTRLLQHQYISQSPLKTGSKHLLDAADDASRYTAAHARYHPLLRNFLERFGYYDMFLVDHVSGHIVYTVYKEVDFGTSLAGGPYRKSNLAEAYRTARESGQRGFTKLVDFEPYDPSYGARGSFIATPVHDGDQMIGVLVFQFPVDRINEIMTSRQQWERVGLGQSGETYIVGEDLTLRNQSRFLIEDAASYVAAIQKLNVDPTVVRRISKLGSSIGLQEVRTEGTMAALEGHTGFGVFPDYRGVPVLSAYRPLDIPDIRWVIMSEIDQAEALAPVRELRNRAFLGMAFLIVIIVGVALWFSIGLTRPLQSLAQVAGELADGRLEHPVEVRGNDEIAELARSFERMRTSLRSLLVQQERQIEALAVPLIPLRENIVALPLVGELDARRLEKVRDRLVEGLYASGAQVALLDLTGVPRLDHEGAEALISAAKAVQLLGVQVVLTGMQAEVAKNLSDLDVNLDGIVTERSLESGVRAALERAQGVTRVSRLTEQEQD